MAIGWKENRQGPNQMRRDSKKDLSLPAGFPHQLKGRMFEIPKAAMH